MDIYHFVKYYDGLLLDNLIKKNKSNAVLCFDLEDSIQDVLNSNKNPGLKVLHRKLLHEILNTKTTDRRSSKIGIRINASNSAEQKLDLDFLASSQSIHTILLPKTESTAQILHLIDELENRNIQYEEIIPIIETRLGITNLEDIAMINVPKIKRIAFGHCDYNLDNNHFPFFHQTSKEYWSWIEKIISIIQPYGLNFVNSPFLELNNKLEYENMLSSLFSICGIDCGQIALTFNQAEACSKNDRQVIPYFKKLPNRLNMKMEQTNAKEFIELFENENNERGFTITSDNKIFLSPQEYLAAKNHNDKATNCDFNFTFVGGCFPIQGSLLFEDLFHQLIKSKVEKQYSLNFNVNIIRYERFTKCINKITAHADSNPIDVLIFCIRPEPILRLTKLSYKFIDDSGKIRRTFNLPFLKHLNPEKFDLLVMEKAILPSNNQENPKSKTWTNLNYFLGYFIGNNRLAMNKYKALIDEIMSYCTENKTPLYIMGPAIRTNSSMEKHISKKLEKFMKKKLIISESDFINGSDLEKDGKQLFHKNGIHANEFYHDLIADRIIDKLTSSFEKVS